MERFIEVIEGVLLIAGPVSGLYLGATHGYKRGQIDALNGKVAYEKKENEQGELVWKEKSKN